jgi:hypothetical protein
MDLIRVSVLEVTKARTVTSTQMIVSLVGNLVFFTLSALLTDFKC